MILAQSNRTGSPVSWNMPQLIEGLDQPEVMPEVNESSLIAEDIDVAEDYSVPYRFAFAHEVNLTLENAGRWTNLPNGDRVWVLLLDCPDAYSMALTFRDVDLPRGARLDIYTPNHQEFLGPITQRGQAIGSFGTAHFRGHQLIVEYFEPYAFRGDGQLKIPFVTEAYRSLEAEETSCFSSMHANPNGRELEELTESVVMMLVDHGQRIATGTLVNNSDHDGRPYLLTAAKSLMGIPEEMVFAFHYTDASCMYPYVDGCREWIVSGSRLVQATVGNQLALLELNQLPSGNVVPFFAGWHLTGQSMSDLHWCIQHAYGVEQSYKKYIGVMQPVWTSEGVRHSFTGQHEGATASGTVGSPLFDENYDLIGVFVGGNSDCQGQGHDYFTLLKDVWSDLDDWLSPTEITGDRLGGMYYSTPNDELSNPFLAIVYPNPAQEWVSFSWDGREDLGSVEILTLQGKPICSAMNPSQMLDISFIPNGTYIVRLTSASSVKCAKLVIQK